MTPDREAVRQALEPCPFCEGVVFGWWLSDGDVAVECRHCGALGPVEDSDHDAITAWNRRARSAYEALGAGGDGKIDVAQVAENGPTFDFSTTVGGLKDRLDENRSVALHLGKDENGTRRWAVRLEHAGHVTSLGLSDEAIDAIVGMWAQLTAQDVGAEDRPLPSAPAAPAGEGV